MIPLPRKIRTTFFNATVEKDPYQLFAHEDERICAFIHATNAHQTYPAFGRSGQDALNSDTPYDLFSAGLVIYGPEPIWMCYGTSEGTFSPGFMVVQGIYHA